MATRRAVADDLNSRWAAGDLTLTELNAAAADAAVAAELAADPADAGDDDT